MVSGTALRNRTPARGSGSKGSPSMFRSQAAVDMAQAVIRTRCNDFIGRSTSKGLACPMRHRILIRWHRVIDLVVAPQHTEPAGYDEGEQGHRGSASHHQRARGREAFLAELADVGPAEDHRLAAPRIRPTPQ